MSPLLSFLNHAPSFLQNDHFLFFADSFRSASVPKLIDKANCQRTNTEILLSYMPCLKTSNDKLYLGLCVF